MISINRWLVMPGILACSLVTTAGWAQETAGQPATAGENLKPISTALDRARGKLDAAELDEVFKVPVRERLDEAAKHLEQAETRWRRAREFEAASPEIPKRIEELQRELAALPAATAVAVEVPEDVGELQGVVERKRDDTARLEAELAAKQQELTQLKARPVEVGARLPAAYVELSQADTRLAALGQAPQDESISREAERLQVEALREALRAEVAMLERERIGQLLREQRAALEQRVIEGRLRNQQAALARLEATFNERVANEITRFEREVARAVDGLDSAESGLVVLVDGLREMVAELKARTARAERIAAEAALVRTKLEELRREREALLRQVELGDLKGVIMQTMVDLRKRLPDRRGLDFELRRIEEEISAAQLEGFRIDDLRDRHEELARRWQGNLSAEPLLELRARMLERLGMSQRALIRDLAQSGSDAKAYRDLTVELSQMLTDRLFWQRTAKPVGTEFFRHLPESFATVVSPDRWRSLAVALAAVPGRHPFGTGIVLLASLMLLAARRKLRNSIGESGRLIRRISTDRFAHTMRALAGTLLLALPIPLVLGFLGWALPQEPGAAPWVRGASLWLGWASSTLLWILSLRELARKGGVGRAHFGWDDDAAVVLRRGLAMLAAVYLPAMFPACVTVLDNQAHAFESIGRLGFVLGATGLAWVLAGMLRPDNGVLARLVRERPGQLLVRARHLWSWLFTGIPLALAILALAGYMVTALMLTEQFFLILRWITLGVVIYGLGLRAFMIKERRLALAEAIQQRKARRAAAENPDDESETGERVIVDDDHIELGLDAVARQTRRLLRSLVWIGVLVIVSYSVTSNLPLGQLGKSSLLGGFGWLDAFKAALIVAVTWTVIKNLPGLLDIAGLRESGMEPGTRYAVATLGQYALGAAGILFVANTLALDWSQFGWIAAALGVGLGFGLQEIVANFVCGIILLFERPIRVGDIVTIGEVSGTVSRIRMRATTITNWDHQEFVVPNKEFITGSLINWTLSSPLNRITISVGVAYGSDTVEARRILAEVAAAHPVVLEEPAPLISFEAFADSSLNLFLRCCLPNLDNRLRIITELHEEINRRFRQAGIEIAFPQRDLHLRSVPEGFLRGERPAAADQ